MSQFSLQNRSSAISNFSQKNYDLLIVGGGINGAGAAREAAMRGLSVALCEKGDYASGTSSRSSKLIHGGIRYLENFEFGLVFEALSERTKLFSMAPHLSHPLRFMIPLFEGGRVGMFKMGLGMWLYDLLALMESPELHERLSKKATLLRQPQLQSKDLLGSYVYSDGYMDDDRLVLETLRSATQHGADCASYCEIKSIEKLEVEGYLAVVHDVTQGTTHTVRARHILVTVGPWTDLFASGVEPKWQPRLRPTKGVHLTFSKDRFPLNQAVVMGAEDRIVFGIPRHDMVILGTTDTDFKSSPDTVCVETKDQEYLLEVANKYFPGMNLQAEDILGRYAGVRPLVQDDAASTGKVSREHTIWTSAQGFSFVAGGKYTTYRLIAKQAVDECVRHFSWEQRTQLRQANSAEPLNASATTEIFQSSPGHIAHIMRISRLTESEATHLFERHGLDAIAIIKSTSPELKYWQYEAILAMEYGQCFHLADFFLRRTPLSLAFPNHGLSFLPEVAMVFQERLGWTPEQTQLECEQLHTAIRRERGVFNSTSR